MRREITIDDRLIPMEANASTPRKYREAFGKEFFQEFTGAVTKSGEVQNLEVFENLAFIMAKQAGSVPEGTDVNAWLDGFDSPMAITNAIGDIMALWRANEKTTTTAKKKAKQPTAH